MRGYTFSKLRTKEFRHVLRTHTCGELTAEQTGETVTVCGWIDSYRDHGGALFVDLRDRYGKTQVVFAPEAGEAVVEASRALRNEDVIKVVGAVATRPEGTINPKLETGEIEVRCTELTVLNKCKTCLLYTSPSPRDATLSRMPSSA